MRCERFGEQKAYKTLFFSFLHVRVLHAVDCLSARWEPMHVNKLLLEVRPSDGSKRAVLVNGFVCCPVSASACPTRFRSPVQWREGEGNPPGQEQSSLREV